MLEQFEKKNSKTLQMIQQEKRSQNGPQQNLKQGTVNVGSKQYLQLSGAPAQSEHHKTK